MTYFISHSKTSAFWRSWIYSSKGKDFVSEDNETLNCFKFLSRHFSKPNIRTKSREYDFNKYYKYFIKGKEKFTIRAKGKRNIIYKAKRFNGNFWGFQALIWHIMLLQTIFLRYQRLVNQVSACSFPCLIMMGSYLCFLTVRFRD